MRKVLIRCDNSLGGLSYFTADFEGIQVSNFVNQATNKPINQPPVWVSFCPDSEYLHGEFTGSKIENLQVFSKRSEAQRQHNMLAIAHILNQTFKR